MNFPAVDIIVCTYNNEGIISKCLDHIKELKYDYKKCIIVDDKSTDRTIEIIKKNYPWARIIEKENHTGPSISRNMAIKNSGSPLILFLDSDVFVKPYFLYNLVECMKKNNIAICGGKLLLMDNTIDSAGGGIIRMGIGFDRGHGAHELDFMDSGQVMYIPSAAMLVKRNVFKKIGFFDETYFYGHEDTDFCWRAGIAGFKAYYEPTAVAYHHKNKTVRHMKKEVYYYGTRNRIRSLLKNHQISTLLLFYPLYRIYLLLDIIIRPYRWQKIRAGWWNLFHIRETLEERKRIQGLRKIKDRKLPFSSFLNILKQKSL